MSARRRVCLVWAQAAARHRSQIRPRRNRKRPHHFLCLSVYFYALVIHFAAKILSLNLLSLMHKCRIYFYFTPAIQSRSFPPNSAEYTVPKPLKSFMPCLRCRYKAFTAIKKTGYGTYKTHTLCWTSKWETRSRSYAIGASSKLQVHVWRSLTPGDKPHSYPSPKGDMRATVNSLVPRKTKK